MLNNLNWPLLQQRRDIAKVYNNVPGYKIINNLISIPHDHITISPVSTRSHNLKCIQLAAKSNTYLFSFFPSAIKLWNSLRSYIYLLNSYCNNIIPYPLRDSFKSSFPHILRESFKSRIPHILRDSFKLPFPLYYGKV